MSVSCRPVVYIASPVRAADRNTRLWHHARAALLGRHAEARGLAPLVPAVAVAGLLEGYPHAPEGDCPSALSCCLGLLRAVKVAGGSLWVLSRDDGSLSDGCRVELDAWLRWLSLEGGTNAQVPKVLRWRDLEDAVVSDGGLHEAWDLLRMPNQHDVDSARRMLMLG